MPAMTNEAMRAHVLRVLTDAGGELCLPQTRLQDFMATYSNAINELQRLGKLTTESYTDDLDTTLRLKLTAGYDNEVDNG